MLLTVLTPLHTVAPQVPVEARRGRLQGECPVAMKVDGEGAVVAVALGESCPAMFRVAAMEAATQWTFEPTGETGLVPHTFSFTASGQGTTLCRITLREPGDFELCEAVAVTDLGELPTTREVSVSPGGTLKVRSTGPVLAWAPALSYIPSTGPSTRCPVLFEIEEDGTLLDARPQPGCPDWAVAQVRESAAQFRFEPTGEFEVTTLELNLDPRGPDWRPIAAGVAAAMFTSLLVLAVR